MLEHFALIIAGLGVFFAGMQMLTEHLKQLTGRKFRLWVAKWTQNRLLGAAWGGAFFAITQSTAATTFIIVSLLASGLIGITQALPMIVGQNMIAGLIVFIVTGDIKSLVLLVLGITGIGYASQRLILWRPLIRALFGAGLLFFGLRILQEGAAPLAQHPWVQEILAGSSGSPMLGLIIGTLLVVITQSSVAISVIAIVFAEAGLFSIDQTIMTVYGANLGASVGTYLLSMQLRGRPRQVSMYQVFYNVVGCLIFVPLFYLEQWTGFPLVKSFITWLTDDVSQQLATVYLIFNLVPGLLMIFLLRPTVVILERLWPPTVEECDARPKFLHAQALNEPESALDLVRLEQIRLLGYFPRYLDIARERRESADGALQEQLKTIASLAGEINQFLRDIASTNPAPETYQRLSEKLALQATLERIDETLFALASQTVKVAEESPLYRLADNLVEGLDAVLLTLTDSMAHGGDPLELELIDSMVDGRSGVLTQFRDAYLAEDQGLDGEEKLQLLELTNHCERLLWLIGHLRPHLQPAETF